MSGGYTSNFRALADKFGERLILNTESFPDYAKDASEISITPAALIFAETEDDTVAIIKNCRELKIPIIFRGAGTGYTGGAVPSEGALILSLERLTRIEINPEKKTVFCGPGVITADLMNAAKKHGLFYPPDPASYDECTLGGNVAENAGGLHCKKYGVTKDYIIGLKAVTVESEIIKTGLYSKRDILDLSSVIIGSEGLLVAVTEIAVRLIDRPEIGPTILAAFDHPDNAAQTVADIIAEGLVPAVMEYMDGDAVSASNAYEKSIDIDQAEAVLLLETTGRHCIHEADAIEKICRVNKTVFLKRENDHEKSAPLWRLRRNLSKAVKASAREKIAEDVCVPPSQLPALVNFVAELNREYPIRINSYGHAGDGNLHVNFLVESEIEGITKLIAEGTDRLFKKTLQLGGTLTGEHGIGLTKKKYLPLEFDPPTLMHMKYIKEIFDPEGLLNPGKMFLKKTTVETR